MDFPEHKKIFRLIHQLVYNLIQSHLFSSVPHVSIFYFLFVNLCSRVEIIIEKMDIKFTVGFGTKIISCAFLESTFSCPS
jgi:hypothetical protein